MPMPWDGGPPTAAELAEWLVRERGLTRDEAEEVAVSYQASLRQSDPNLTEAELEAWVDRQLGARPEEYDDLTPSMEEQLAARDAEDQAREDRGTDLADQRASVARNQAQTWLDRAMPMEDSGPAWDPAALATSLAIGMQTDAAGNPILDESGSPMGVSVQEVWENIRKLRFDMGRLAIPYPAHRGVGRLDQRPRSTRDLSIRGVEGSVEDTFRRRRALDADAARWSRDPKAKFKGTVREPQKRFITPSEALALLGSMDEDYITKLQQEMWEAGLYGEEVPSWGSADATTRRAFITLFTEAAMRDPGKPINRILRELADENVGRLGPPEDGPGSAASQELVDIPDFTPEVTSAETLSSMIDDIATGLFGEKVDDERRADLIARLQGKEVDTQRKAYDQTVAGVRESAMARQGGSESTGGEIDLFMQAIGGQESGGDYTASNDYGPGHYGKYQISATNWGPWAMRAGLGPNAPQTPENQEIVARRIMLDYYNQFGNWRDVAVAWYAGPGRVAEVRNSTRAQRGGPSIARYADEIMDRMGRLRSGDVEGGLAEVGGRSYDPIETFDPQAEAEAILKAQDPIGWQGHEFADRALEFYSLLGGVV